MRAGRQKQVSQLVGDRRPEEPVDAEPQKLFATPLQFGNHHPYAVAPDGQRFLFPRPLDEPPRLILDWHTLLPR